MIKIPAINMRYLFYILLSVLMTVTSCRDNEIVFEGPYHVRFTDVEMTELESHSPVIPVSVHLVGPQRGQDIEMTYTISGNAREGKDFEIIGDRGVVIIPRNESFGYIDLKLINNSNNILESQDIIFRLESVTPSDLEIGFGDRVKAGKELTFTVLDDCILGGLYTGYFKVNTVPVDDVRIRSVDCITYVLENWDINVFGFPQKRDLVFTDNGDNTLVVPEQEEDTFDPDFATLKGDGVVNPVTREITFNIQLVDFEESPVITLKYKPQL